MKINILIATLDAGICKVEKMLMEPIINLKYVVSHQVTKEQFSAIPENLKRDDVIISQLKGKGLSRNRNNAIALADGDIGLVADDDTQFKPEYIENLIDAFESDRSIDVACFKIATPEGKPDYKDYPDHSYLLNDAIMHFVSSIEIAFKLDAVKSRGLQFHEQFGIGSPLISYGEEAVFIHDCIKSGLKVKYIPSYVVEHASESTVKALDEYASERVLFKGAYDAYRYGWLAFPAAFVDLLRLWKALNNHQKNKLQYLKERLQGIVHIYK